MIVENTNVKLTFSIPIDKPDKNGTIYTKEAISNALNNLQTNLPIICEYMENEERIIGITTGTSHIVTWDFDNQTCNVTIDGVIFQGGIETVLNKIKGRKIIDFRISGFGLTR